MQRDARLRAVSPLLAFAALAAAVPAVAQTAPRRPPVRTAAPHPLDPLTAREITLAVQALRAHPNVPAQALFPLIALHEPSKDRSAISGQARPSGAKPSPSCSTDLPGVLSRRSWT